LALPLARESKKPGLWTLDWTLDSIMNSINFQSQESEVMPNYSAAKFWHYLMLWAHPIYTAEVKNRCQSTIFEAITLHRPPFSKPQFVSIKAVKVRQHRVW